MTKSIYYVFTFTIFLILFSSCASTSKPIIFNESLPQNEMATIYYIGGSDNGRVNIIEYNGNKVNWRAKSSYGKFITIQIPGGNTQFILDGKSSFTIDDWTANKRITSTATYRRVPFVYNFEKGKEYTIEFHSDCISVYAGKPYETRWRYYMGSPQDLIVRFSMSDGRQRVIN